MRWLALWTLGIAGCAAATAESTAEARGHRPRPRAVAWDPRPVDALLAEARGSGKRVVVEFSAVW